MRPRSLSEELEHLQTDREVDSAALAACLAAQIVSKRHHRRASRKSIAVCAEKWLEQLAVQEDWNEYLNSCWNAEPVFRRIERALHKLDKRKVASRRCDFKWQVLRKIIRRARVISHKLRKNPKTFPMLASVAEGSRKLVEYVNRIVEALTVQKGAAFAALLAITPPNGYREVVASSLDVVKDPARILKQIEKHAQLGDMLVHHTRAMHCFQQKRYVDAYNALEKSASAFLQEFRGWDATWPMEALHTLTYELRTIGEMADREMAEAGKMPDKLKGAGQFLTKVFGALAGKGVKRVGALYVTCQLFKVYFKLGTVHLCRSVIRSIETARVFDFEDFPVRDRVTYMYYTGRLEVFNDNFAAADEKLTYALKHCDPSKKRNIRMILKYLVPVKLSIGILPREWLLQKYNLVEYVDVIRALQRGDVRLLRHALKANEDQFLRSGVYLVLEKLEIHVYRRLLKKIYIIQKQRDPGRAHQVRMDIIVKAMKWLEVDMDLEEVECIMAILIHKNFMKGYFSHKSRVVVLSKQDPFPKLSSS